MNLSKAVVIYVDFESHYGKDYTLSTMPTQAYVMDERFHDHGACVAINGGPIKWFTHELLPKVLPALHAKYPNAIWVAHNWLFDGTILSLRYGVRPSLIVDTASMSRAIIGPWLRKHDLDGLAQLLLNRGKGKELRLSYNIKYLPADIETKIATYCALDVDLMREALRIMAPHFPACELSVMTWVSQMMTQPTLHFDEQMLRDYHESVVSRKTQLLFDLQIDRKDLMSNDKFAVLLDRYAVDPPTKWSKPSKKFPGGRITWAFAKTDKGLKDLLEHENPDVQALVAARMQVKSTIEETRSKTYMLLAAYNPICIPLAYSGAIPTHRLGGRDKLNFQNLKRGGVLRKAIHAGLDEAVCVSDSSQIELRLTLLLARHFDALEFLASGGDLYSDLAIKLYDDPTISKKNAEGNSVISERRHVGKEVTLGSGYGMGAEKCKNYLQEKGVKVTAEFAQQAIDLYRSTYNGVPRLWRILDKAFRALLSLGQPLDLPLGGITLRLGFEPLFGAPGVELPNGLWIKYPDLAMDEYDQWTYQHGDDRVAIWGGNFLEHICQALARIIVFEKSVKIHRLYPVALSVHDEVAVVVKKNLAVEASREIHEIMIEPVPWMPMLKLGAETKYGYRYGEAK